MRIFMVLVVAAFSFNQVEAGRGSGLDNSTSKNPPVNNNSQGSNTNNSDSNTNSNNTGGSSTTTGNQQTSTTQNKETTVTKINQALQKNSPAANLGIGAGIGATALAAVEGAWFFGKKIVNKLRNKPKEGSDTPQEEGVDNSEDQQPKHELDSTLSQNSPSNWSVSQQIDGNSQNIVVSEHQNQLHISALEAQSPQSPHPSQSNIIAKPGDEVKHYGSQQLTKAEYDQEAQKLQADLAAIGNEIPKGNDALIGQRYRMKGHFGKVAQDLLEGKTTLESPKTFNEYLKDQGTLGQYHDDNLEETLNKAASGLGQKNIPENRKEQARELVRRYRNQLETIRSFKQNTTIKDEQ